MFRKFVMRGVSLLVTAGAVALTSACGARGSASSGDINVASSAAEGGVASTSSPSVLDTGQSAPSNGFSESEKLIFQNLLYLDENPEAGWADSRPNGVDLRYHNDGQLEDIVRAPLDSDGPGVSACSFYVTHELTAISDGRNNPITIMISKDKGATWYSTSVELEIIGDSEYVLLQSIEFLDDKNGFLVVSDVDGDSEIFMTDDAGVSWEKTGTYEPATPFRIEEATFASREIGFLAGKRDARPFLAKTTDGGKTWKDISGAIEIQPEWEHSFLQRPKFQDQYGIITLTYQPEAPPYPDTLHAESMCLATNDYGETWSFYVMIAQNEIIDLSGFTSDGSQTPPITIGKNILISNFINPYVDSVIEKLGINMENKSAVFMVQGYVYVDGENMFHVVCKNNWDRADELLFNCAVSQDFTRFYLETDSTYELFID